MCALQDLGAVSPGVFDARSCTMRTGTEKRNYPNPAASKREPNRNQTHFICKKPEAYLLGPSLKNPLQHKGSRIYCGSIPTEARTVSVLHVNRPNLSSIWWSVSDVLLQKDPPVYDPAMLHPLCLICPHLHPDKVGGRSGPLASSSTLTIPIP